MIEMLRECSPAAVCNLGKVGVDPLNAFEVEAAASLDGNDLARCPQALVGLDCLGRYGIPG